MAPTSPRIMEIRGALVAFEQTSTW